MPCCKFNIFWSVMPMTLILVCTWSPSCLLHAHVLLCHVAALLHIVLLLFMHHDINSSCPIFLIFTKSLTSNVLWLLVLLITSEPWCLFAWFLFPSLPCHVYCWSTSFSACLHSISCLCNALKCASWCWQIVLVTCFACIFLTVTPFGCSLYVTWLVFHVICFYAIACWY